MRIVQGNDVVLNVPLLSVAADGTKAPITVSEVTELKVTLTKGSTDLTDAISVGDFENLVVLRLEETLPSGSYNIKITGKLDGNDICYNKQNAFEIVRYNAQSDYLDKVNRQEITLDEALFVSAEIKDEDIAALKEQLANAIADNKVSEQAYLEDAAALVKAATNLSQMIIRSVTEDEIDSLFDNLPEYQDSNNE